MYRRLLIAIVLAALFLPGVALADQISQFLEQIGGPDFSIIDNVTYQTFSGTSFVNVIFDQPGNWFGTQAQPGTLVWSGTSTTTPIGGGSYWTEGGFNGWFSILDGVGNNLFSGTFQGATLITIGQSAFFADTGGPPTVTFTSRYLDFTPSVSFTLSLAMTLTGLDSQNPTDHFLVFDQAAATGTFYATPPPNVITPEPAALLLSGGALLGMGFLLRKRKRRQVL